MLIFAHIFGVPFEELIYPVGYLAAASALTYLVSAVASRWRRRW